MQHLAHSRAAGGALVADDHHVARVNPARLDRREGLLLAVEDARGTAVQQALVSRQLHHAALGREIAAQDGEAPGGLERRLDGHHHLLPGRLRDVVGDLLQGATVHGGRGAVDLPLLQQLAHHQAGAARVVEVHRHVLATGLDVGDDGRALRDGVELIDGEGNAELTRDGHEVHHGVGGATRGGDRCHGVVDGTPVDDVGGRDVLPDQPHDHLPGLLGRSALAGVGGRDAVEVGRGEAEELAHHGHGVGGELPATGTRARAGRVLDLQQLVVVDLPGGVRADALEHILHRHVAALVDAGRDGPVVEDDAGDAQAAQRHDGTGDGLVAPHQAHHGVERVPAAHQLDAVGDHLAADERGLHALGAHGHAVRHRHGVELHRRAAGLLDPDLHVLREIALVDVARHGLDPRGGDAHDGLRQGVVVEADGLEHGPGRRAVGAVGHDGALPLRGVGGLLVRVGVRHAPDSNGDQPASARARNPAIWRATSAASRCR